MENREGFFLAQVGLFFKVHCFLVFFLFISRFSRQCFEVVVY